MQTEFWHQLWDEKKIGFHLSTVNPLLRQYFSHLNLNAGQRIFLPLCGKTLDIHWLLAQGLHVVGVELSTIAVDELFSELDLRPQVKQIEGYKYYQCGPLEVWNGNFFTLSREHIGKIDAVYDRAALVALPTDMRLAYSQHLTHLSYSAPQLLVTIEYDQSLQAGPPFSITASEVFTHYGEQYAPSLLASSVIEGGLKGRCAAQEHVWLLEPAQSKHPAS